jgi:hypothetical protein
LTKETRFSIIVPNRKGRYMPMNEYELVKEFELATEFELVEYRPGRWAKVDTATGEFLGPASPNELDQTWRRGDPYPNQQMPEIPMRALGGEILEILKDPPPFSLPSLFGRKEDKEQPGGEDEFSPNPESEGMAGPDEPATGKDDPDSGSHTQGEEPGVPGVAAGGQPPKEPESEKAPTGEMPPGSQPKQPIQPEEPEPEETGTGEKPAAGKAEPPKEAANKPAPAKPKEPTTGHAYPLGKRWGLTSTFQQHKQRNPPSNAPGIDVGCPRGTPVQAMANGRVIRSRYTTRGGRSLWIEHSGGVKTYYAHLRAAHVLEGETVTRGQKIGESGSTGKVTGPHLHFSVVKNGQYVNPMKYIPV